MKLPVPYDQPIPSVAELNRDVESFVIQASAARTKFFEDPFVPLQFVHFADVHYETELWDRLVEYMNEYSDVIEFALHTGDYCKGSQAAYRDLYNLCRPSIRPIFNCVGNHDAIETKEILSSPKRVTHSLLFNKTDDWDVTFMEGDFSMTYYKDFGKNNIRLVVLDGYYDREQQVEWLKNVLSDARERGYHVITATHEATAPITEPLDVTFNTRDDFIERFGDTQIFPFDGIIAEFKQNGGKHICHLGGHYHHDRFGYTAQGVLNVMVECATDWPFWCDGKRVRGTRTYDCFNVVSVDVNQNLLKLVRVGNNCDHYLRQKSVLCYDYQEKKVICNR